MYIKCRVFMVQCVDHRILRSNISNTVTRRWTQWRSDRKPSIYLRLAVWTCDWHCDLELS